MRGSIAAASDSSFSRSYQSRRGARGRSMEGDSNEPRAAARASARVSNEARRARSRAPTRAPARATARGPRARGRTSRRNRSRRRHTPWPSRRGRSSPAAVAATFLRTAKHSDTSSTKRSDQKSARRSRLGSGPSKGMFRSRDRGAGTLDGRTRRSAWPSTMPGGSAIIRALSARACAGSVRGRRPVRGSRRSASPVTRTMPPVGQHRRAQALVEADRRRVPVEHRPLEAAAARATRRFPRRRAAARCPTPRPRCAGRTKRSSSHRPRRARNVEKVWKYNANPTGFAVEPRSALRPPAPRRTAPRAIRPRSTRTGASASRTRPARGSSRAIAGTSAGLRAGSRPRRVHRDAPGRCACPGSRGRARRRRAPRRAADGPT